MQPFRRLCLCLPSTRRVLLTCVWLCAAATRRFTKVQAKREKMVVNADTRRNKDAAKLEQFLEDRKKKAKIGDAGFEFHSGWPMPGEKNYRKNVMQDKHLADFEKDLERRDMTLEDYMKQKSDVREMDRCEPARADSTATLPLH